MAKANCSHIRLTTNLLAHACMCVCVCTGVDLEDLLEKSKPEVTAMMCSRQRRALSRGLPKGAVRLMKKLRKAKTNCPEHEKPTVVNTHLRNVIIFPDMIGSVVGIYNGQTFNPVDIKVHTHNHTHTQTQERHETQQFPDSPCLVWSGLVWFVMLLQPAMVGRYLGEFAITYKPISHGRPGVGATHSSRFIPLK